MHQGVPNQQLVSPAFIMGPQNANALLLSMLDQLPPKRWWVLFEKSPHDAGLSKAFSIPRVDIEALLINTGLYKRTRKGVLFFQRRSWQIIVNTLPDHIKVGSLRKNVWYFCNGPPEHPTPGDQERLKVRISAKRTLSDDILAGLRLSGKVYDDDKSKSAAQARAAAASKAEEAEAATACKARCLHIKEKAQAQSIAAKVIHPLLSSVVNSADDINMCNPAVENWAKMAVVELNNIYSSSNEKVEIRSCNTNEVTYLAIPKSRHMKDFEDQALRTKWIKEAVEVSIGSDMDARQAAIIIIKHLQDSFGCLVSDSENTETDDDDSHSDDSVSIVRMNEIEYHTIVVFC